MAVFRCAVIGVMTRVRNENTNHKLVGLRFYYMMKYLNLMIFCTLRVFNFQLYIPWLRGMRGEQSLKKRPSINQVPEKYPSNNFRGCWITIQRPLSSHTCSSSRLQPLSSSSSRTPLAYPAPSTCSAPRGRQALPHVLIAPLSPQSQPPSPSLLAAAASIPLSDPNPSTCFLASSWDAQHRILCLG